MKIGTAKIDNQKQIENMERRIKHLEKEIEELRNIIKDMLTLRNATNEVVQLRLNR